MKERKYKEEYRLETQLDVKTGKPKQIPVYMGDYYRLAQGATGKQLTLGCISWLVLFAVFYGTYLMLNSPSAYCIYVQPLAACATIPVLYAVIGAVNALRAPKEMTRVQKETGVARLMRSFIGCGVFTALAFIGDIVFMLRIGFAGELLAALALLLASVCAWTGFACVRRLHNGMDVVPGRAAQQASGRTANEAGEQG